MATVERSYPNVTEVGVLHDAILAKHPALSDQLSVFTLPDGGVQLVFSGVRSDTIAAVEAIVTAHDDTAARRHSQTETLRRERDVLLRESDWTQLPDVPITATKRTEWATYRQALRDLPSTTADPFTPVWPTPPVV